MQTPNIIDIHTEHLIKIHTLIILFHREGIEPSIYSINTLAISHAEGNNYF